MITKELNEWIRKVEIGAYNNDEAMEAFIHFCKYLTREEMQMIRNLLKDKLQ